MRCGSTSIDEYPTSPVANPADNTNNRVQVDEVWRGFKGGILPEAILVFYRVASSDVRKEERLIPRLVYCEGLWEVKLDHALKFTEKSLPDEVFGFVVVGVAVNEAFVLWQG